MCRAHKQGEQSKSVHNNRFRLSIMNNQFNQHDPYGDNGGEDQPPDNNTYATMAEEEKQNGTNEEESDDNDSDDDSDEDEGEDEEEERYGSDVIKNKRHKHTELLRDAKRKGSILKVAPDLWTRDAQVELFKVLDAHGMVEVPFPRPLDLSTEELRAENEIEADRRKKLSDQLGGDKAVWSAAALRAIAACGAAAKAHVPTSVLAGVAKPRVSRSYRAHGPIIEECKFWEIYKLCLYQNFPGGEKAFDKVETVMVESYHVAHQSYRAMKAVQKEKREAKAKSLKRASATSHTMGGKIPKTSGTSIDDHAQVPKSAAAATSATTSAQGSVASMETSPRDSGVPISVEVNSLQQDGPSATANGAKDQVPSGSKTTEAGKKAIKEYLKHVTFYGLDVDQEHVAVLAQKKDDE